MSWWEHYKPRVPRQDAAGGPNGSKPDKESVLAFFEAVEGAGWSVEDMRTYARDRALSWPPNPADRRRILAMLERAK